ncbi:MAG: hypothetical protein NVSMB6_00970 [Burkholderiaceae bacterium]
MLVLPEAILPAPRATPGELAPYDDANDRLRHLHYIERLAQETDYPTTLIEPIYEQMLARLKTNATIHDYLPILVTKSVKTALKQIPKSH